VHKLLDEKLLEKFYLYLSELEQSYGRLIDLLHRKTIAINTGDLAKLDAIMKEEQVYVLLSRGFEGNLRMHRKNLGLTGEKLTEIIDELPDENRPRFELQLRRLRAALDSVKGLNEQCQQMIENRLYSLDKSIKALDKSENTNYKKSDTSKQAGDAGPRLFTKSI
jgi:hypothetical protein